MSVPLPPDKLGAQGPPGGIVTKGGLVFIGGGDAAFHAIDKATGLDLWSAPTAETTGTPMTYLTSSRRQFVAGRDRPRRRCGTGRLRTPVIGLRCSESGFRAADQLMSI